MAIKSYFDFLHKLDGHELDSKKIMEIISKEFMPFAHVAEDFVLIETSTRPVFISYDDAGREIESQLRQGIRSRSLMREAGRFMVNVYCGKDTSPFEKMAAACKIEVLDDNVAILVDRGAYSSTLGLKQEIEDGQAVMF